MAGDTQISEYFTLDEFTKNVEVHDDNTVTGEGVFDVMMETATKNLVAQFNANRITGEDYGTYYTQIYIATLQALLDTWAKWKNLEAQTALITAQIKDLEAKLPLTTAQIAQTEAQTDLITAQKPLYQQQVESEKAKTALYRRQIEGFDENFKEKMMKIMIDGWTVGFSVAKDNFSGGSLPAPITASAINDMYNTYVKPDFDTPNAGSSSASSATTS